MCSASFFRAFLAVLSPVLMADLGIPAAELASASGWWFLAFAAMQIPIGESLDRWGPRRTTGSLMAAGAAGALLFSQAIDAFQIKLAMALIGVGCSPVLMASYFIFARSFSPAVFGTLAGVTIGVGALGNVASSLPLSAAVEAFGWRPTMLGLAGLTGATAILILILVRDPPRLEGARTGSLSRPAENAGDLADPGDDGGLLHAGRRSSRPLGRALFCRCPWRRSDRGRPDRPLDRSCHGRGQFRLWPAGSLAWDAKMGGLRRQCP